MIDLTVVIVAYNCAAHLRACAGALDLALHGLATRIVVVDNASTDDSLALARQCWPEATVIPNLVNRGFAPAVNQGLARASGRAVLLLNPDAFLAPDAATRLLAQLDHFPAIGIVSPRLVDSAGHQVLSCYPFPSILTIAWRYLHLHRVAPNWGGGAYQRATTASDATAPLLVPWAQGACLLLRTTMIEQLGGLDERFVMYAEEVDLARRAADQGWTCVYLPTATVRHDEGSSAGRVPRFKLVSHYFSALAYFDKHVPSQVTALKALFAVDLTLRWLARLSALVTGRPVDAAERRSAYGLVLRSMLFEDQVQRHARWQALAASSRPRS